MRYLVTGGAGFLGTHLCKRLLLEGFSVLCVDDFSTGTKQNIEDLTFDQIRIVGDLKPKVVVCENVKGLTMDYAREYLTRMISEFEKEGYITDYQVLNGWQYGVPQKRERIFIVSIREDIADSLGINFLNFKSMVFPRPDDENKPTIRDAIQDLQDEHFIPMHRDSYEEINVRGDHELNLYLKAHEQMHIEWAVGSRKK